MIEIALGTPYAAAIAYYLVQLSRHGVIDQTQVVAARNNNVHPDAAPGRRIDGAQQDLIGQKIGRLYAYVLLRHGKGTQQHVVCAHDITVGTRTDAACRSLRRDRTRVVSGKSVAVRVDVGG